MSTTIVLADDHRMMREGLRAVLEQAGDMRVVGEADDGRGTLEVVERTCPDIVVMDVGMPDMNGIEATRRIGRKFPDVRVVALSTYSDKRYVLQMLEAGAAAYLVKNAACEELVRAIRAVCAGKGYLSSEITGVLVDGYVHRDDGEADDSVTLLGSREREVLQLVAEGKSSKQIAEALHIATKTVETHRRNISKKLGIRSVAELTKYAVRQGLTTLEH